MDECPYCHEAPCECDPAPETQEEATSPAGWLERWENGEGPR